MSAAAEQVEAKTTTMAALRTNATTAPDMQLPEVAAGFNSLRGFELLQRAGKALSAASLIPENYRGNLPNCIIALELAQRIGASPLLVMQNLYVVYGRPAWSAKFLIACFNQCGRFSAVRYLWSGTRGKDDWGCQSWAIEKSTGEKILGPVITLQLAKDEGWYGRKDSKWKTMPEKMFMYRSAAWMIDTHAPELSMGIRTDDEVRDTYDASRNADGQFEVTTESLREAERGASHHGDAAITTDVDKATGEITGKNSGPSDYIPLYDAKAAIAKIREATTLDQLTSIFAAIAKDFELSKRELPVEVEMAFGDRKALIEAKK